MNEARSGIECRQGLHPNRVQAIDLSIPSARECCRDYMVERPEKGGADSISAAEAARAAGAKLGLGVLVPGIFCFPAEGRMRKELHVFRVQVPALPNLG